MQPTTDVWLPEIKIAGIKSARSSNNSKNPSGIEFEEVPPCQRAREAFTACHPNTARKADERLADDKIGEELAPDATIWEIYQEEAKDFDDELIDSRSKNLDMMLLFVSDLILFNGGESSLETDADGWFQAGLFSSVVTSFLVESKKTLQQDYAYDSMGILLRIAQSQQRMEEGTHQAASPMIEIPPFEAPTCARLINGFWFASLALSLCAALIAMLAKEWLTSFGSSRPRSPYALALLHQRRLRGLDKWYALRIIDFLPTVLHFALLLFSAGLVAFLWTIDYAIAMVIVIIVGLAALFYVTTAILASTYPFCPFVTQVSKYIGGAFSPNHSLATSSYANPKSPAAIATPMEVLQALQWLAGYARDPIAADCCYQALAGVKVTGTASRGPYTAGNAHDASDNATFQPLVTSATMKGQSDIIAGMFQAVCSRIPQTLVLEGGQISASHGISISRYANALPHLVHMLQTNLIGVTTADNIKLTGWKNTSPVQLAFNALGSVWSGNVPYYTPDAYALLVAAELRLVSTTAPYSLPQAHESTVALPETDTDASSSLPKNWSAVDMIELGTESVPLFELRARFSRTLFRASLVLKCYADRSIDIRPDALAYLLNSIRLGFSSSAINPERILSTHQSQNDCSELLPVFRSSIGGTGISVCLDPLEIGDPDGILSSLVQLIYSEDTKDLPELARSATLTLSVAAPILLRQWLTMNLDSNLGSEERDRVSMACSDLQMFWPKDHCINNTPAHLSEWAMEQLIIIAHVTSPCHGYRGGVQLSLLALQTLCQLTKKISAHGTIFPVPFNTFPIILKILSTASLENGKTDLRILQFLMQWLLVAVEPSQTTVIENTRVCIIQAYSKDLYLEMLHIWAQVPGLEPELQGFVDNVVSGSMHDARHALWNPGGLSSLLKIGLHTEYAPIVAKLMVHMATEFCNVHLNVVDREASSWQLAVPYFVRAGGDALKYIPPSTKEHVALLNALTAAAYTWRFSPHTDLNSELHNEVLGIVCRLLCQMDAMLNRDDTWSEHKEHLEHIVDPEGWMYGVLPSLFDHPYTARLL